MEIIIYILFGLAILVIILSLIAPKSYEVNRNIVINKALPEVFKYISHVKNQDFWSPWAEKDPNMKKSYVGSDGEVGFVSKWDSKHKQVGAGEQEILEIIKNKELITELRFLKPFKSTSTAYIKVKEVSNGTEVVWGFLGKNKFPVSIMMLFMNMEKAVGGDFEQGLAKLKSVLENN